MNIQDMVDRNEWLKNLKEGDEVALDVRRLPDWTNRFGYKLFRVIKITPKKTRFDIALMSESYSLNARGEVQSGSTYNRFYHKMVPVTAEVMASIQADTLAIKVDNRRYRLTNKLEQLRDTLKEKREMHLEFLAASDQLAALLDKYTKPDPEDS